MCPFRDSCDVVMGDLGRAGGGVWLVRPDGYLAATGIVDSVAYLESVFHGSGLASAAEPSGPVSVTASLGITGVLAGPARPDPMSG
jgi:hypothetical protein